MLRSDCAHLKQTSRNEKMLGAQGTLRCDVNRGAPDPSSRAGLSCPMECMGYRPRAANGGTDSTSALSAIRKALMSLIGK